MPPVDYAAQLAEFKSETYKDGEPADGAPTAEEQAAHEANQRSALPPSDEAGADSATGEEEQSQEGDQDGEDGGENNGEGQEHGGSSTAARDGADSNKPEGEKKGKGSKNDFNKRIGDLTAARRTAEREAEAQRARADELARQLEAAKSGSQPLTGAQGADKGQTATAAGAPDPSKFEFGELDPKYIAALARHEAAQEFEAQRAKDEQSRQSEAAAAAQRERNQKIDAFAAKGAQAFDDFDDVVMRGAQQGTYAISDTLGTLIVDSDFGPQIAYELAKDPDEAARVSRLTPAQQAAYFGRQEAKFEAAKSSQGRPPPKAPQAPPPPKTPRGGSGTNKVGADTTDFAALEAAWRSGALR